MCLRKLILSSPRLFRLLPDWLLVGDCPELVKVIPTLEQRKTIEKYGLRFDDVQMGPGDGEITVKDTWTLSGMNKRKYVISRDGTFEIQYETINLTED